MTFNWRSLLKVSDTLHTKANSLSLNKEAFVRSSINRTYYAIYNHTLIESEKRFGYSKLTGDNTGRNHTALIEHLKTCNIDIKLQTIGSLLASIKRSRGRADYIGNTKLGCKDSKLALENANQILGLLKQIK